MVQAHLHRIKHAKTHFSVLDVPETASEADIKKAFRKLALLLHPDKCDIPGADEAFKSANLAHETLSDESKRSRYTELLRSKRGETFRPDMNDPTAGSQSYDDSFHASHEANSDAPDAFTTILAIFFVAVLGAGVWLFRGFKDEIRKPFSKPGRPLQVLLLTSLAAVASWYHSLPVPLPVVFVTPVVSYLSAKPGAFGFVCGVLLTVLSLGITFAAMQYHRLSLRSSESMQILAAFTACGLSVGIVHSSIIGSLSTGVVAYLLVAFSTGGGLRAFLAFLFAVTILVAEDAFISSAIGTLVFAIFLIPFGALQLPVIVGVVASVLLRRSLWNAYLPFVFASVLVNDIFFLLSWVLHLGFFYLGGFSLSFIVSAFVATLTARLSLSNKAYCKRICGIALFQMIFELPIPHFAILVGVVVFVNIAADFVSSGRKREEHNRQRYQQRQPEPEFNFYEPPPDNQQRQQRRSDTGKKKRR